MTDNMEAASARPEHAGGRQVLGREILKGARRSPLRAYRDLTVGSGGWGALIRYELLTSLLGPVPGGLGFLLRKHLYRSLFRATGNGLFIGRNVTLRHPGRMYVGDSVTLDDQVLLDARGADEMTLEEGVMINRNCQIQAKQGNIRIGRGATVGSNSVLVSMAGIDIGERVMIAGGVYVSAGAYHIGDVDRPIMEQGAYSKGPIRIGDHAWIGTGAIILDGVTVGRGAVVGAGAVVTKDVPDHAVVAGTPARVLRQLG